VGSLANGLMPNQAGAKSRVSDAEQLHDRAVSVFWRIYGKRCVFLSGGHRVSVPHVHFAIFKEIMLIR
jgi:hypothetical protein